MVGLFSKGEYANPASNFRGGTQIRSTILGGYSVFTGLAVGKLQPPLLLVKSDQSLSINVLGSISVIHCTIQAIAR